MAGVHKKSHPSVSSSAHVDEIDAGIAEATDIIEGGNVLSDPQREPRFDVNQHRALTAEKLAKWFTAILAGGLLLHYLCMMILVFAGLKEQVEAFGQVFHGWFPAMTSIVSAAATFYFAKERER